MFLFCYTTYPSTLPIILTCGEKPKPMLALGAAETLGRGVLFITILRKLAPYYPTSPTESETNSFHHPTNTDASILFSPLLLHRREARIRQQPLHSALLSPCTLR